MTAGAPRAPRAARSAPGAPGGTPTAAGSRLEPGSRLQFLPGIGPRRALLLERLGLTRVEHLMRHYPRQWLDARRFVRIADLVPGQLLTVEGTIHRTAALRTRGGRTDFVAEVRDGSGALACYFFGQPFLARSLPRGARVVVSGERDPLESRMLNPLFEVVAGEVESLLHVGRLIPVHALTRGISARAMRQAVRAALAVADRLADPLPEEVRAAHTLLPVATALRAIHFPESPEQLDDARRRLAFEELFLVQMVLALRRRALEQDGAGLVTAGAGALAARARAALPWPLTGAQEQALTEIVADMRRESPMHRMLLGDVGSGKTVVALLAALHALEAGHQVAFMAPTEILARQHATSLARLGAGVALEPETLTGATPAAERRRIGARLDGGEPLLVVGTHALLEATVRMPRLGLAIVDEQHRFGVRQRSDLARKGTIPDLLVLTATPIPRTLMLACFGDLQVSTLRERPPGRGRLVTRVAGEEKWPQVLQFVAAELAAGRQAFVVVPLIEDAGRQDARAAEAEHRRLAAHPLLRGREVALLHGRLKAAEKQAVMERFAAGEVHVLVATSLVEVGVDVPNATVMVIENADRFGLSQLHQLRGRVGRSSERSVCVLIAGAAATAVAHERLELLTRTTDGFEIAEADLRLRGPGEMWGFRQSGLPRFRLAEPGRDGALLEQALGAARAIVAADPWLRAGQHDALRQALLAGFAEPLDLALAG